MENTKTKNYSSMVSSSPIFKFMLMVVLVNHISTNITLNVTSVCKELNMLSFTTSETNYPSSSNTMMMKTDPISNETIDLELQMTDAPVSLFTSSCHSIELGAESLKLPSGATPSEIRFKYKVKTNPNNFSTFKEVHLVAFFTPVTSDSKISLYLLQSNVESKLNKVGSTFGFAGYVDGDVFNIVLPETLGDVSLDATGSASETCGTVVQTIKDDKVIRRNCVLDSADFDKWFINQASYNIGTWMLIGVSTIFFILLILTENKMDMNNESLKNNPWTLYPFYSIWKVGSEQHTKISKLTQMFLPIATFYLVFGILVKYYFSSWGSGTVLGAGIGIGLPMSWVINYILGCLLRRARNLDVKYLDDRKRYEDDKDQKLKIRETFERKKFMVYYEYYLLAILYVLGILVGKKCLLLLMVSYDDLTLRNSNERIFMDHIRNIDLLGNRCLIPGLHHCINGQIGKTSKLVLNKRVLFQLRIPRRIQQCH